MKNTTKKIFGPLFVALCACALVACGDGGATGTDAGSEEANLSSDGGSSDSDSSSEGTSGEGGSETASSSSSWVYSYAGPGRPYCTIPGTAVFNFSYSVGNGGVGTMYIDDSHYEDSASAETVLLHADGNYYPGGQGWTEGSGWECPRGGLVEEPEGSGNWVSPCYWGWNDADMLTDNSVLAGVKLKAYVDPDGWGHVNGGFYYVNGTTFSDAQKWNVRESISVVFKGVAGMPVKIYARDKVRYADGEGVPMADTIANGQWQMFTAKVSDFRPRAPATNALDPAGVIAVGLQYELAASEQGQSCTQCSATPRNLEWQALFFD